MTKTGPPTFVDREPEIRGFCDLLKSERSRSVMLIGGGEWIGKTWLLQRMVAECQSRSETPPDGDPGEISIARVNFRSRRDINEVLDTLSLIRLLRKRLGQPSYFGHLADIINQFTERGPASGVRPLNDLAERMAKRFNLAGLMQLSRFMDVRYEDLPGPNRLYEKAFQLADYHHRTGRLPELIAKLEKEHDFVDWRQGLESLFSAADLKPDRPNGQALAVDRGDPLPADQGQDLATRRINDAFFRCLNGLSDDGKLVVLLFDGCEKAPPNAKSWIRHQLLDRLGAGELGDVVVILAGRTLPDVSDLDIEHLVDKRELDSFDQERVRQFFEAHDVAAPTDLEFATRASAGIPGELARWVDRLRVEDDKQDSFYG